MKHRPFRLRRRYRTIWNNERRLASASLPKKPRNPVNARRIFLRHHLFWLIVQTFFIVFATDFLGERIGLRLETRQTLRQLFYMCGMLIAPVLADQSIRRHLQTNPIPATVINFALQWSVFGTILIFVHSLPPYWLGASIGAGIGAIYLLTSSAKQASTPSIAE